MVSLSLAGALLDENRPRVPTLPDARPVPKHMARRTNHHRADGFRPARTIGILRFDRLGFKAGGHHIADLRIDHVSPVVVGHFEIRKL
ncbi:hypothetical protein [Salipiger aestuarii]|uniref:hypothetical protein n=1 Tax=Salipiger aestuarii TaxID=568098 RepID=UPI0011B93D58|nr:hypothetical protein [Salipiger aestuarii]